MLAVDHHGVLPGGETRDDAAPLDAAKRRDERGRVLSEPRSLCVGECTRAPRRSAAARGGCRRRRAGAQTSRPGEHEQYRSTAASNGRVEGLRDPLLALRAGPRCTVSACRDNIGGRDQADVTVLDMDDSCAATAASSSSSSPSIRPRVKTRTASFCRIPQANALSAGLSMTPTYGSAGLRRSPAARRCGRAAARRDRRRNGNQSGGERSGRATPSAPRTKIAPMTVRIGTQRTRYPVHP